jgi:hypothetical protein
VHWVSANAVSRYAFLTASHATVSDAFTSTFLEKLPHSDRPQCDRGRLQTYQVERQFPQVISGFDELRTHLHVASIGALPSGRPIPD